MFKKKERRPFSSAALRDEQALRERYVRLYGEGNYDEEAARYRKERRLMLAAVCVLFALLLAYALYSQFSAPAGVTNGSGDLISISRPTDSTGETSVAYKVYILSDDGVDTETGQLTIKGQGAAAERPSSMTRTETAQDQRNRELSQIVRDINAGTKGDAVVLPTELEDGSRLVWREERQPRWILVLLLFGAAVYLLYRTRFRRLDALEKEASLSVIRELPEFINQLVLLMNAGIVLEQAFDRVCRDIRPETYFSKRISEMRRDALETRTPLYVLFRRFAAQSGVMELARLSSIIYDNMDRGTDLVEKLRGESTLLWFERKKQAEEQGRLAETKMTFPLVLLLLVLLLVTVAPALMEM